MTYKRYQIDVKRAENIVDHPHRFHVKVNRLGLAKLLLRELFHYSGDLEVVLSRPCVYGVFSGPLGGFMPREKLCVGCLRCTVEHPDFVTITPNRARNELGDSYFTKELVDTVVYEAETGQVPIKGAGYRGGFGGKGWDGLWTDMSEIVRPTRDGIHGREFISTSVDIGGKVPFLTFAGSKEDFQTHTLPIPFFFDPLPSVDGDIIASAAERLNTFAMVDFKLYKKHPNTIPILTMKDFSAFRELKYAPQFVELDTFDENLFKKVREEFKETIPIVRVPFDDPNLLDFYEKGVRTFHLTTNYQGLCNNMFVIDLIQKAHRALVERGIREEVTLIGSGGIIAVEHVAKAILLGLDAVAIDTPILVALQGQFKGEWVDKDNCPVSLPNIPFEWGVRRLTNLAGSWRNQLLELLGAMGLREIRRARGEKGRLLFQKELEKEAFRGIDGYE